MLDFSKAFDKVSHHRLLLKLVNYGLYWIKGFLIGRTQSVILGVIVVIQVKCYQESHKVLS